MLPSHFEEGKEKCPYDPARGYTGLIVGKQHLSRAGGDMQDAIDYGPIPNTPPRGARRVGSACRSLSKSGLGPSPTHLPGARGCWWSVGLSSGCRAMLMGTCPAQMEACTQQHATSFGASLTFGGTCTSGH